MNFLLRISGPNANQEVAVPSMGAGLTLGRDASADVVLPDPEKWISRKHVLLRQTGDALELHVTSTVNGIETSRGPVERGQSIQLALGDFLKLGAYRVDLAAGAAGAAPSFAPLASSAPFPPSAPSASPFDANDPFAALLGGNSPSSMGDDPFSRPEFRPAPAATKPMSDDPFAELAGFGSGGAPVRPGPPPSGGGFDLNQFGATPSRSGPGDVLNSLGAGTAAPGLNDWLGGSGSGGPLQGSAGAGPLDAFLGRSAPEPVRALSPDHVHGINLPMSFRASAATPAPAMAMAIPAPNRQAEPPPPPPPIPPPAAPVDANADVWANLMGHSDIDLPMAAGPRPAAAAAPQPQAAPTGLDDVFASIGGAADDDAFADWSATVAMPPGSVDPQIRANPVQAAPQPAVQVRSAEAAMVSAAPSPGDAVWAAFARGLGLPASHPANEQAAERAGAMVRLVIEGLAVLLAARADLKRELRADDRTMLSGRDNNPLKLQLSAAELVEYLFTAQASAGYMPAERAVRESIAELGIHEHATIAAARAAVEGALRDFEPARLQKLLLKGKSGMFQMLDNAKLWDAYQQHYEKQSQHMADWLELMFNRHFMPTYSRETERLKMQQASPPAAV